MHRRLRPRKELPLQFNLTLLTRFRGLNWQHESRIRQQLFHLFTFLILVMFDIRVHTGVIQPKRLSVSLLLLLSRRSNAVTSLFHFHTGIFKSFNSPILLCLFKGYLQFLLRIVAPWVDQKAAFATRHLERGPSKHVVHRHCHFFLNINKFLINNNNY